MKESKTQEMKREVMNLTREKIIELYYENVPSVKIASSLGVHHTLVSRRISEYNEAKWKKKREEKREVYGERFNSIKKVKQIECDLFRRIALRERYPNDDKREKEITMLTSVYTTIIAHQPDFSLTISY